MSTPQQAIQADWENREFVETISTGIKRITEFLNNFGKLMCCFFLWTQVSTHLPPPHCYLEMSTRYRLAVLNEKLTSLERSLEFMEAKVRLILLCYRRVIFDSKMLILPAWDSRSRKLSVATLEAHVFEFRGRKIDTEEESDGTTQSLISIVYFW